MSESKAATEAPPVRLIPTTPGGPTLAEWAERMRQGGKLGADQPYQPNPDSAVLDTSTASPCTASPRDTGEVYPATRMVGVVEFLRSESRRWSVTPTSEGVLRELEHALEPDSHLLGYVGGNAAERHLARCLYTLDGVLRDARKLSLSAEAQERLRELMIEMSRP